MNNSNNEFYLYCRKSSEAEDKQTLSIHGQIREMKEFAQKNGYVIKETFTEEKSAFKPNNRPEFDRMIRQIKEGKCRRVLTWHLSRMSRNALEGGLLQQMVYDEEIYFIKTPQDQFDRSTNSIILGVLFGSNYQFSKDISKWTKNGIKTKIERGMWPTRAPLFYKNVGNIQGEKNIEPDEAIAHYYVEMVDQIIKHRFNGNQARQLLNKWGVKSDNNNKISHSSIHRILRNPIYCGIIRYGEYADTKGSFKPIISEKKWNELQDILDDRSKPKVSKHNFAYNKLLKCAKTGLNFSGYEKIMKNGKRHVYYQISSKYTDLKIPQLKEEDIEAQLIAEIKKIELDNETVNEIRIEAKKQISTYFDFDQSTRQNAQTQIDEFNKKLSRLMDMKIDGLIDPDEFKFKRDEIREKMKDLKELETDIDFNKEDLLNALEGFFDEINVFEKLFVDGDFQDKRTILNTITEEILVEDRIICSNFRKPFDSIVLVNSGQESIKWGRLWKEIRTGLMTHYMNLA